MCPVVTMPQEFHQIVFKHISRSTCLGKTSLGDPPCILDVLSMSTGVWVNEVQGVVDCEMLESLIVLAIIGSPQVAHYASAWQYAVLDDGERGCFVAGINRQDKTFLGFPAYSPKHPLTFHHSTSIVLLPAKLGLVNLNNLTRTPYPPHMMSTNNFCTNLAAVIIPINHRYGRSCFVTRGGFVHCLRRRETVGPSVG